MKLMTDEEIFKADDTAIISLKIMRVINCENL